MFDLQWVVFVQVDMANKMLWPLHLGKSQHRNRYNSLVPMYLGFVRLDEEKKRGNELIMLGHFYFQRNVF